MGEFADIHLDEILDPYWEYHDYYEIPGGPIQTISSAGCGKFNLHWRKLNNKWRLYEPNGRLHNCKDDILEGLIRADS